MNTVIASPSFPEKKDTTNKTIKRDLCNGLSDAEVARSKELYGNNSFSKKEKTTFSVTLVY